MTTASKTKEKIILTSIELFNRQGVVAVTTNHIAKELGMSPGNLYFHFANKEEIILEIFRRMAKDMYQVWRSKKGTKTIHPLELIEKNFEVFWKYRFFHREMYYIKRKDLVLAKAFKAHIHKLVTIMTVTYKRWLKLGWMVQIKSKDEVDFLVNVLLATASTFLQFFESAERQPARAHIETGKKYVARLIMHYTQAEVRKDFEKFLANEV